ncbi:MAG: LysR family transcriptional regulator [Alphaproteobacteria bacterium]|nr:MAG: LysR family transcriptional regulator [Alphaproteobacteria bacterium]
MPTPRLVITLRLLAGDVIAIGPGKADLLAAIATAGSIAAAARSMGLSYRRAWLMVEAMNTAFAAPLVVASKGGGGGGGALLSEEGQRVLSVYRAMVTAAERASAPHAEVLLGRLCQPSGAALSEKG